MVNPSVETCQSNWSETSHALKRYHNFTLIDVFDIYFYKIQSGYD